MTFIDLETNNGTIIAEQIVRLRPYSGQSFKTVITLANSQEIFTEKTIQEIKEAINGQ